VLWTLSLIVVLFGSLFVRDINHAAHGAISPRRSENRNFAALANVLITRENLFDQRLDYLLTAGQSLSRSDFYARLEQLDQQLPDWSSQASLLAVPSLAHHVNTALVSLTSVREVDYDTVLAHVAAALDFPWTNATPAINSATVASAQASLVASNTRWGVDRWALIREPGRVTLPLTSDLVGTLDLAGRLDNLARSPSLGVTRGIGITAVLVDPSPLPAPTGELLLPPSRSIRLGVTLTNASFVLQPVVLRYTFVQTNGARTRQGQTMTTTLAPLGSYAFVPGLIGITSGERGQLTIVATGAPAGATMSTIRHYSVVVSPSGNS
jgi:hypothetical protein